VSAWPVSVVVLRIGYWKGTLTPLLGPFAKGIEMTCTYCGGEMQRTRSTYTIDRAGSYLFIKDVLAYVCSQCSEKHFQESKVAVIQQLIRDLEKNLERVHVSG